MSLLFIVSESEADAVFYALCAERLTGIGFHPVPMKNRKGDGLNSVKAQLKYALRQARHAAGGEAAVYFLAAIDNDRAPHPENAGLNRARLPASDQQRPSHADWMVASVEAILGGNRAEWPLSVALAVPVEMLESWIVRACEEAEPQPARHFSHQNSASAREYYKPSDAPPQWKELAAALQMARGHSDKLSFYAQVIGDLDAAALARRSASFRIFKDWIDAWPKPARDVSMETKDAS